jgi:ABC-type nitrate/sulfonate/bicarbonate transport system substrate-binding protein
VIASGAVYDSKTPFAGLCVATDSTITSGKDFEGKIVGTPALNDLNQLVFSAWVDAHGGDPKTLKFVELPNSTAAAAIAQHRVEGAVLLEPLLAEATDAKQVKYLAPAYDAMLRDRVVVRLRGLLHVVGLCQSASGHRRQIRQGDL